MKTKTDWPNAPEDATHWGPEDEAWFAAWYQECVGVWLHKRADGHGADVWRQSVEMTPERIAQLIPRPTKPRYIAHYGGECPVDPAAKVEVVFRDGDIFSGEGAAYWPWHHSGEEDEIIAYRILTDGE